MVERTRFHSAVLPTSLGITIGKTILVFLLGGVSCDTSAMIPISAYGPDNAVMNSQPYPGRP